MTLKSRLSWHDIKDDAANFVEWQGRGMEIFAILTVGAVIANWWAWRHR